MFDSIKQVLQMIKTQFGIEIFNNHSRFTSALNDFANENKNVKNLLRIAVCDLHAYSKLKKGDSHTFLILAREMSEDYMIPYDIALGVMECISALVGPLPLHGSQPDKAEPSPSHTQDKIVRFGLHDWRVLDVHNGKALLLSERILEKRGYHNKLSNITWENCALRQYLNGAFCNTFSQKEKSRIAKIKTANPPNKWFGTDGGKTTEDKLFLLSVEEVIKYFGNSGQWGNKNPDNHAFINDRYNNARKTPDTQGLPSWWWLRSPGEDLDFAAYVNASGMISMDGFLINLSGGAGGGIRPALWIDLN
ncbi:MAG: DUF6273 domain-containing protein [Defluviitaleaceae bacterium]|nr:DUF6273 domain-containing protein [Defluviitaleaceae bacterium]